MPDSNTLERCILLPRMTAAALSNLNPILKNGQIVFEADTQKHKSGDGVTPWNSLPYGSVNCVNGLDSDSTVDPLSAAQGKALKQNLETMQFGSRNLLLDSGTGQNTQMANHNNYLAAHYTTDGLLKTGQLYTLYFEAVFNEGTLSASVWLNNGELATGNGLSVLHGQRKIYKYQFTGPQGITLTNLRIYKEPMGASSATVYWAALYEGDVQGPLTWMPAVRDTFVGKNHIINSDFSRGLYGITPNQRVTLSINQHPDGFLFLTARSEQETSTPGVKLKLSNIEYGREYTITFKYSASTAYVLMTSVADYSGATAYNTGAYEKIDNSGGTRTFKQTIRINKNGNENKILHECYLFIIWAGVSGQVILNLWDLKMEKGSIATDWCLSEDDFAKMADYAQSFISDGYAKLPNGLILQWMVWKEVTPNVPSNLVYPIAFPKAQTAIMATCNAGTPGQVAAGNESQSGVQIVASAARVNVFALGY